MHIVSERALMRRINRRLVREGERLHACHPASRWHGDLGCFYMTRPDANSIIARHVGIEALAADLGALRPGEALAT